MDKSLDDIIATRPRNGRRGSSRRGAGGRAQILGTNAPASPAERARAGPKTPKAAAPAAASTTNAVEKIMVSNLPQDVNEAQVKELFHATVGPVRNVTLHYDASGRSKGIAAVQFTRKGDGHKAFQQYNSRLIDGKRPMRIEILVDPRVAAPATLAARVAPAATAAATDNNSGGRSVLVLHWRI
ncbi:hypothetical protein HGRIS_011370 [Hohenbuehelia grisea]|uniref:RRM domain-containing protein n=1 Tax=Hohenbuehelia grisea TaxID=104357 RepID=A0ABR3JV05_9AGAR